ncbi:MAG: hypothetical protein DI634_05620 [Kocuria palustris]|nr:MAG: hypothetical protein DI634_05620 [Kocuria palustris]
MPAGLPGHDPGTVGPLFLQPAITGERKAVWVLLVIALPLLGSLGWLFLGRPGARRQLAAVGQG